jgi:beta-glucosidase
MTSKWQCPALVLVVWLTVASGSAAQERGLRIASNNLTRGSFPKGFVFGTAASAYQVSFLTSFFFHMISMELTV